MSLRLSEKNRAANIMCVLMLCLSTSVLVGFSTPQHTHDAQQPAALTTRSADDVLPAIAPPDELVNEFVSKNANEVANALTDLAEDNHLRPTEGRVNSRTWLPTIHSSIAGQFHGVGFPDIRTYPQAKRSPFAPPGPWAPLVEWRSLPGEQTDAEPIAKVRCMGLTPKAVARRADRYRELIYAYAEQFDISAQLVKAVITEESCFNNKALSKVGAQGLMQLMPDTASWLKVNDPHDPADNLRGGVRYLAALKKEFDSLDLALAAYNAGPGNVRRYNGVPPFAETRAYVVKVQANYRRYKAAHRLLNPLKAPADSIINLLPDKAIEQARVETTGP